MQVLATLLQAFLIIVRESAIHRENKGIYLFKRDKTIREALAYLTMGTGFLNGSLKMIEDDIPIERQQGFGSGISHMRITSIIN